MGYGALPLEKRLKENIRNYSFSKAAMDYCMWMDADDILEEIEADKFLQLQQSLARKWQPWGILRILPRMW